MGPDFFERLSLWFMFCCNFICLPFLIFNSFFLVGYPVIRPVGYPTNKTGYPAGYRISKKTGYPTGYQSGRISGATLFETMQTHLVI